MYFSNCIALSLCAAFGIVLVEADCSPRPIPIRIGNVTLATKQIARGLDIKVGSPPQSFAFLPQWPLNNSFIYGNGYCESQYSTEYCATFRGGLYDQFGSSTRKLAPAGLYPIDGAAYPKSEYVTDNFTLSDNITLKDFPIAIPQNDGGAQGYFPQAAIGLGQNSTVLNTLKAQNRIASRSWGMFWGRTGGTKESKLDGNFVFGGYDREKTLGGRNYTKAMSENNQFCSTKLAVTITDITLNFPNGTDASLFKGIGSTAINACIVPTYPVLLTLPLSPYFNTFQSMTNSYTSQRSFGINFYGMLYGASAKSVPYNGDITITIDSGLSVRIPNDQLVVPNLTIDPDSGGLVQNSSAPELVINAIQGGNADDLPQLGRQFLTAAYLLVNQDSNEFTLWKANPTANEDIVAVDTNNKVITDFCSPVAADSANSTSPAGSDKSGVPEPEKKSLGTGAIAGIAVAGAVLLALLGFAIFWFLRKRRNGAKAAELANNGPPERTPMMDNYGHHIPSELYSGPAPNREYYKPTTPQPPQELASKPAVRPEPQYELSSEPLNSYR